MLHGNVAATLHLHCAAIMQHCKQVQGYCNHPATLPPRSVLYGYINTKLEVLHSEKSVEYEYSNQAILFPSSFTIQTSFHPYCRRTNLIHNHPPQVHPRGSNHYQHTKTQISPEPNSYTNDEASIVTQVTSHEFTRAQVDSDAQFPFNRLDLYLIPRMGIHAVFAAHYSIGQRRRLTIVEYIASRADIK